MIVENPTNLNAMRGIRFKNKILTKKVILLLVLPLITIFNQGSIIIMNELNEIGLI